MPKINHEVPDFDKKYENFKKKLETKKSVHEKVRPKEFNMTRREAEKEQMKNTLARSMSSTVQMRATIPNAQKSLANFKKAEEKGKNMRISFTKKFEDTRKLRLKEREMKEKD